MINIHSGKTRSDGAFVELKGTKVSKLLSSPLMLFFMFVKTLPENVVQLFLSVAFYKPLL